MVYENTEAGTLKKHPLPQGCRWTDINEKSGISLLNDYKHILLSLSTGKDADGKLIHEDPLISAIYADAQTRLREPRHLEQMIKTLGAGAWEREKSILAMSMAKAFRGELTADWRAANPDLISGESRQSAFCIAGIPSVHGHNSAEALLEKIKAEREALQPKKKTRTRKRA